MSETIIDQRADEELLQSVAQGEGFYHAFRHKERQHVAPEAIRNIEEMCEVLCLAGKRPCSTSGITPHIPALKRLASLLARLRRAPLSPSPRDALREIVLFVNNNFPHLPQSVMSPAQGILNPQDKDYEKFLAYNTLIAHGVTPQIAEQQVIQMFNSNPNQNEQIPTNI